MAAEPGVLKRQRSRPSDWWAVKETHTSPVPALGPAPVPVSKAVKKAAVDENATAVREDDRELGGKYKRRKLSAGVIKEVLGAGNRGRTGERKREAKRERDSGNMKAKTGKGKERGSTVLEIEKPLRRGRSSAQQGEIKVLGQSLDEGEAQKVGSKSRGKKKDTTAVAVPVGDTVADKPLRRGRSSAAEGGLGIISDTFVEVATNGMKGKKEKRRKRPAAARVGRDGGGESEGRALPKKRGRSSAARTEEQADELLGEEIEQATVSKKRGRISAGTSDGAAVQKPERMIASKRRSGHFIARVEDQDDELVAEEPREEAVPEKRGRRSLGQIEGPVDQGLGQAVSKKRGRRAAIRNEGQGDELVADIPEEEPTLKKRGQNSIAPTGEEAEDLLPKISKTRGRPSHRQDEQAKKPTSATRGLPRAVDSLMQDVPAVSRSGNMRFRLHVVKAMKQEANNVRTKNSSTRGQTCHRKSDIAEQEVLQPKEPVRSRKRTRQSDMKTADDELEKRGRRETRSSKVEPEKAVPEPVVAGTSKPTKPSRRSEIVEVEIATSKLTKNRGGKRSKPSSTNLVPAVKKGSSTQASVKTKKSTRVSNATSSASSQTHKKGSKRLSQVGALQRKRKGVESEFPLLMIATHTDFTADAQPAPTKRQRIEKAPEQDQNNEPAFDLPNYQHLEAVTKNVSRRTIEAKWEALPSTSTDRILQLLRDLQKPVVARLNDERKKTQASTALDGVSRKLATKISRGLPFPPSTRTHREDDFDFEKILDHNRALEAQLTPVLHSNELLEVELSKEMARLELDMEILAELERNAKAEASVRNQAGRKLHSVLQPDSATWEIEHMKDDIGLDFDRASQPLDLAVPDDENLQALVKELDGHVETIQGNIKQVRGISQAMVKSKAAVQATLFEHLDRSLYDDVVLGTDSGL